MVITEDMFMPKQLFLFASFHLALIDNKERKAAKGLVLPCFW